jgi:hypothetical protein
MTRYNELLKIRSLVTRVPGNEVHILQTLRLEINKANGCAGLQGTGNNSQGQEETSDSVTRILNSDIRESSRRRKWGRWRVDSLLKLPSRNPLLRARFHPLPTNFKCLRRSWKLKSV